MFDRFFDKLTRGIELVLAVSLLFAVGLNFVNVIERYGFDSSVIWAEEVQVYIMICMAFLGAVVATWRNIHLRMDMLLRSLPEPLQRAILVAEVLTMALLSGFVVYQSAFYAQRMFAFGKLSDVAHVPMWIPHSAIALGFSMIFAIALVRLARLVRPGARAQLPEAKREGAL